MSSIGKQWRPRCNATEYGISPVSALFARINMIKIIFNDGSINEPVHVISNNVTF